MPEIKVPGPDHPITIEADTRRLQVRYQGHVIVDSRNALVLTEAGYKPVCYFPREDAAMEFFTRAERVTYCPYKGEAHYFTLFMDGELAENAVWTYEDPYPAVDSIRGRLAFYPNLVEIAEVDGPPAEATPDDVVLHTDAGVGASQQDHWPPNTQEPSPLS